jgi:GNAT superfamily N-acetyltransferase
MMRRYSSEDFMSVRNFLVDTYATFQRPYNWTIERWNFSISMARIMNGVSLEQYESQIAIWERDQEIVAVVTAEGENDGEAFFLMENDQIPDDILQEMFAFCDDHLGKEKDGKRVIYLRIPLENTRAEKLAQSLNYAKQSWIESVSELSLDQELPVELAEGFFFKRGDEVTSVEKGEAHARAFGYYDETLYRERSPKGYQALSETPDYRPDLDLYALSPGDGIAAFTTMWYDQQNRIGMLEPVGTIPQYRKLGLARACIMQLANQVKQEGGLKVYVGSGDDFYQRIGFRAKGLYGVWMKEIAV